MDGKVTLKHQEKKCLEEKSCFEVLDLRIKGYVGGGWNLSVGCFYVEVAIPEVWRVRHEGSVRLRHQRKGLRRQTLPYPTCNSSCHHHFLYRVLVQGKNVLRITEITCLRVCVCVCDLAAIVVKENVCKPFK